MIPLQELYQEIILENNSSPYHHYRLESPTHQAEGFNPLCGDRLTVYLKVENNKICEASFIGTGCAISQASASLMIQSLEGKTLEEAQALFSEFHDLLTTDTPVDPMYCLTHKWAALSGVRAYPVRVKCATLSWHTFQSALETQSPPIVSTE
ncbi:MAG: SUF system NifU family Fe-S cluster assembly protein [Legionellaceae bacterium]|nr:SUF system NifU family Fe-S cluster assembly protein [Legionellaceae bacterium]